MVSLLDHFLAKRWSCYITLHSSDPSYLWWLLLVEREQLHIMEIDVLLWSWFYGCIENNDLLFKKRRTFILTEHVHECRTRIRLFAFICVSFC